MYWAIFPFPPSLFTFFLFKPSLLFRLCKDFHHTKQHFISTESHTIFIIYWLLYGVSIKAWYLYNKMTLNKGSGDNFCCSYNPPTTVSTAKWLMWTPAYIRILFLCSERNRAKSTQNKHLLWTGLCFQCGLEPLNESRGQFPKRLGRTNTSSFLLRTNVSGGDRVRLRSL